MPQDDHHWQEKKIIRGIMINTYFWAAVVTLGNQLNEPA